MLKEEYGRLLKKLQKPYPKSNPKFTKLCPVKLFFTKGDLLMDPVALRVHSDSYQQSDLNLCLKVSQGMLPPANFNYSPRPQALFKPNRL
jgi:hypothetical protein